MVASCCGERCAVIRVAESSLMLFAKSLMMYRSIASPMGEMVLVSPFWCIAITSNGLSTMKHDLAFEMAWLAWNSPNPDSCGLKIALRHVVPNDVGSASMLCQAKPVTLPVLLYTGSTMALLMTSPMPLANGATSPRSLAFDMLKPAFEIMSTSESGVLSAYPSPNSFTTASCSPSALSRAITVALFDSTAICCW